MFNITRNNHQLTDGMIFAERTARKLLKFPFKTYPKKFLLLSLLLICMMPARASQSDSLLNAVAATNTHEQMLAALNTRLHEAKANGDTVTTSKLYATISYHYMNTQPDYTLSKKYLDTAFVYAYMTEDNALLGDLHYAMADHYRVAEQNDSMMVRNYYHAISYYEKSPKRQIDILDMLYRIAYSYLQRFDNTGYKRIADRMMEFAVDLDNPEALFVTYPVVGTYYRMLYNKGEDTMIDSIYMYEKKTVDIYDELDSATQQKYQPKMAIYYSNLVDVMSVLDNPDWEAITTYINKAATFLNPADTNAVVRNHHSKSRALFNQKMYDSSITEALAGLELLNESNTDANLLAFFDLYSILAEAYEKKEDYMNAFRYAQMQSEVIQKINERENTETIQELQTRYEVAKKEENIERLTERNRYQERIRYLILGILALTVLVAVGWLLWFRRKRRADADALKLAHLQQRQAELKAEMEAAKFAEKEREFDALTADMEMQQIKSYLNGLEAERTRLAAELHDNVSNTLLGLEFKMKTPDVSQTEIIDMLHSIHEHVRNISHALMPPVFQYATLAEIITDYVYMQNSLNGPRFECNITPIDEWDALPQETALELHRITQESCGNALKHSGASLISIILQRNDRHVTLTINDNGCGINPDSKKHGVGLQIIRNRASKMNGIADITSVQGVGTTVTVRI
ncbi:MAG: hypothetical protein LBV41_13465 [Cytophagaceae bacterium]|jgi:signal transduction histidine kinase|nr:hypothetical protein [Cytophagaceae bacterium]